MNAVKSRSQRMAESWSKRAAVKDKKFEEFRKDIFQPEFRDYPEKLIPFNKNHIYISLDDQTKSSIDILAWIYWNKRVVETEELIVAPAISKLLEDKSPFQIEGFEKTILRQALIDENFHSYMHEIAIENTIFWRDFDPGILKKLTQKALIYRRYKELSEKINNEDEKNLALIAWCFVGELSIYEFLNLVSSDLSIQPFNRKLVELHEKDECGHAGVFEVILLNNFDKLDTKSKKLLIKYIKIAMDVFLENDWLIWEEILKLSNVNKTKLIIQQQVANYHNDNKLTRSYKRIYEIFEKLRMVI